MKCRHGVCEFVEKTGSILATLFDLVSNDSANMTKHVLTQTTLSLIIKYIMTLVEELSLVVLLTPTIDRDIPVSKVRITESVNDIYLVISYLRSIQFSDLIIADTRTILMVKNIALDSQTLKRNFAFRLKPNVKHSLI